MVLDLIASLDAEIAKSEDTITWLKAELVAEQQRVENARHERATVWSAYQRLSGAATPHTPADASWRGLSHVDAVEAALRETGHPLHLTEIVEALVSHGNARLTKAQVSANLTHLKQFRGTVVNVGKGRWNYAPPTTAKPNLRVVPADDAEKLPSQGVGPDLAIPVADTGRPIA